MCDGEENARAQDDVQNNSPRNVSPEDAYREHLAQWLLLTPVYYGGWSTQAPDSEYYNLKGVSPARSDKVYNEALPWENMDEERDRVLRLRSQRYNAQVHVPEHREQAQRSGAALIRSHTTTASASASIETQSVMDVDIRGPARSVWMRPAPVAAHPGADAVAHTSVAAGTPLELHVDEDLERVQADSSERVGVSFLSTPPSPLFERR